MASPLDYSKSRLNAVIEEVRRLKEGDFPYVNSKDALERLEKRFLDNLNDLNSLSPSADPFIVNEYCGETLHDIFRYTSLLGFILRSTNVRNSFEVYAPIFRLSKQILGTDTKLILSSEWELSPITYCSTEALPDFVFIGLPAHEADNPLLLPLAGHELGHTIWTSSSLDQKYESKVEDQVINVLATKVSDYAKLFPNDLVGPSDDSPAKLNQNIFVKKTIFNSVLWALRQVEEYFCDCIGLHLFDQSYLHAFAYLLSPKTGAGRPPYYPSTRARIKNLVDAAAEFEKQSAGLYQVPSGFEDLFEDDAQPFSKETNFLLSLADESARCLCGDLIKDAQQILLAADTPKLQPAEKSRILKEFKLMVPASRSESLTNLLNAGWDVFHNSNFWDSIPDDRRRQKILQELLLKNIEIIEIEERIK